MRCADRDDDARFANLETPSTMNDADLCNLKARMSFPFESLEFLERHRSVGLVDQIQSPPPACPFARVAIKRNCRATLRQHHSARDSANIDRLGSYCQEIVG